MGIHILDQPFQKFASYVAFAVIVRPEFVLGSRPTVRNMGVDVRVLIDKIANFLDERVMVAIASPVNEPHGSVSAVGDCMQDAYHGRYADTGTDKY